jgi:hypothetical protein
MTNVQLYFAIGVPTFTVLLGILLGIYQSNQMLNQINLCFTSLENRFTSLESRFEARMSRIEDDMKTLVRLSGDLDVRLARLEERLAR